MQTSWAIREASANNWLHGTAQARPVSHSRYLQMVTFNAGWLAVLPPNSSLEVDHEMVLDTGCVAILF